MTPFPPFADAADIRLDTENIRYSICTLVTRGEEYKIMAQSFQKNGFSLSDCEYLYLDNTAGNRFDAFRGYNVFLTAARGEYVILCHQDTELLEEGRARLDMVLSELTRHDPDWGLCGNAGGIRPGRLALRISDPHGENVRRGGPFPVRVASLDENFIIVRRRANLGLSHDLCGFHLYGADLCILAKVLGLRSYVIDFHLCHRSSGQTGHDFQASRKRLIEKYQAALRPRWITTTVFAQPPAFGGGPICGVIA